MLHATCYLLRLMARQVAIHLGPLDGIAEGEESEGQEDGADQGLREGVAKSLKFEYNC
jgi:hypothetical protein